MLVSAVRPERTSRDSGTLSPPEHGSCGGLLPNPFAVDLYATATGAAAAAHVASDCQCDSVGCCGEQSRHLEPPVVKSHRRYQARFRRLIA
jgi:hypothetical protein